jgi:hypothetical protein
VRPCQLVAEDLERWTERTPDRAPTFGLAREAERLPVPAPPAPAEDVDPLPAPSESGDERGPFLTHLLLPWSYGDHDTLADKWRRLRCRRGRHEMIGGQTMQVGGSVTFLERRCRWCEAASGS